MSKYKIACIPGDGIGNEVVPEGIRVLEGGKDVHQMLVLPSHVSSNRGEVEVQRWLD